MLKVEEILPFSSLQCLKMKRSHACSHVLSLPVTVNSLLLLGKPCLHQLTVESETWELSVNKDEDTDISTNDRPDVMLAGFGSLENTPNTKSLFFFFYHEHYYPFVTAGITGRIIHLRSSYIRQQPGPPLRRVEGLVCTEIKKTEDVLKRRAAHSERKKKYWSCRN